MRTGPSPLAAHIGLATAQKSYEDILGHVSVLNQNEKNPEIFSVPGQTSKAIQDMLLGIQKYHAHPYVSKRDDLETIWQKGEVRILRPAQKSKKNNPDTRKPLVVLVPSLINGANILDLMPEQSLLHWLCAQEIDAVLLDWGESCADTGMQNLHDVITQRLVPALCFLREFNRDNFHALGYCMGGTMLAGAACQKEAGLQSLIMLAAPWDFHAGSQALLQRIQFWAPTVLTALQEKDFLPPEWLQVLFASLDPALTAQKFARFNGMDQKSAEARIFVAVEDWLNNGLALPSNLARQCIKNWFLDNDPGRGCWQIKGEIIAPEKIKCPVFVIASDKDRLVELPSARSFQNDNSKSAFLNPACGHISMMAGRQCRKKVWEPIAKWIHSYCAAQ